MKIPVFIFFILLMGCKSKEDKITGSEPIETDSLNDFYEKSEKINYDYSSIQGVYDHESTTQGFKAVISMDENGNDLLFTLSVSQGDGCKGEVKGSVFINAHAENYYTGFYQADECRLQFSFMFIDNKIDIKEISLCRLHGSSCSFEGLYIKRKN